MSKSLGTVIAGEAARQLTVLPIRHLYLTPIGFTIPYLQQAQGTVITGTADKHLGDEDRRQIRGLAALEVIEIPGAGHSLELPDDLAESLRILGLVCATCTRLARGTW